VEEPSSRRRSASSPSSSSSPALSYAVEPYTCNRRWVPGCARGRRCPRAVGF
jgi:hypothetical protein